MSVQSVSAEEVPLQGPVTAAKRIHALDVLRGWALFGVFLMNFLDLLKHPAPTNTEGTVGQVLTFLFASKSWPLLSCLFGLGFAIQLESLQSRGQKWAPVYLRRLIVLFLFGWLNWVLGGNEILIRYALLGLALIPFRNCQPKTLLLSAASFLAISAIDRPLLSYLETGRFTSEAPKPSIPPELRTEAERQRQILEHGTFAQVAIVRSRRLFKIVVNRNFHLSMMPRYFGYFLLGLYVARRRLWTDLAEHRTFFRRLFWWGLVVGLIGNCLLLARPLFPKGNEGLEVLLNSARAGGRPALAFCYAAALVLLVQREGWQKRLDPLAAVGRVALTTFILQSLCFLLLLDRFGLDWQQKLSNSGAAMMVLLLFGCQVLLATVWLRHFRFGPLEWIWKTSAYARVAPFRQAG